MNAEQSKAKIIKRGQGTVEVDLKMKQNSVVSQANINPIDYKIKASKLVKFKDTKLEAIQLTQSGSKGKLLVTFDRARGPVIRFHKIKGIKNMQQFDFSKADIDYTFADLVETTRIELKSEPNRHSINIQQRNLKNILYYSSHIIAVYQLGSLVDIYKVNGPIMQTIDLQQILPKHKIVQIEQALVPRLDWQEREFDQIQRAAKQPPRKILFTATYMYKDVQPMPMLILYDREKPFNSVIKLLKSRGVITCVNFGPYDNGHILVGTSTGDFFAFDSITLKKLCNIKLSETQPVNSISLEWT